MIDLSTELGAGEYGITYKGTIKRGSGAREAHVIPVAVKTVRINVHIDYFKAHLSELKILAYVGQQENVVNLIGAHTAKIKWREIYVGVQLCECTLLSYLTKNREQFEGDLAMSSSHVCLIRWAREIAAGMEFLSQRRVVHGGLAAKTVYLSPVQHGLHAKIGDFGLPRQLIGYKHMNSKECPLPWKWMAPESLSQMEFSTKSDVWAYGVTLWELFSIGRVPYAGLDWDLDFVNQLHEGLRLEKPAYASISVFGIMKKCWTADKKLRLNFGELKNFFKAMEHPLLATE